MSGVDVRHRALLGVLARHGVDFVLVGGVALQMHGFSGVPTTSLRVTTLSVSRRVASSGVFVVRGVRITQRSQAPIEVCGAKA